MRKIKCENCLGSGYIYVRDTTETCKECHGTGELISVSTILYEYKILRKEQEHTEEFLNKLGLEGWEVVATSCGSYGLHTIILKRVIN